MFVAAATAACVSTQPVFRGGPGPGPVPPEPSANEPPGVGTAPGGVAIGKPRFVAAPQQSCVPYARARSGFSISGDANVWVEAGLAAGYGLSARPVAGAVMALRIGPGRGHVAYVKALLSPREIVVDHANWHGRGEVAVDVPVVDVSERGDWSRVRVQWLDSGEMGARIYPVEGFILPHGQDARA